MARPRKDPQELVDRGVRLALESDRPIAHIALGRREPGADVELVHHSDRGSQYTSIDCTQTLTDHCAVQALAGSRP
jgi:hypothetical protein